MRGDPSLRRVDDGNLRLLRLSGTSQRQQEAITRDHAETGRHAGVERPGRVAVGEIERPAILVADNQHPAAGDAADILITLAGRLRPEQSAIVQIETRDGVAIGWRDDDMPAGDD